MFLRYKKLIPFYIVSIIILLFVIMPKIVQAADNDQDGLDDTDEIAIYHTDPNKADTDNDSYNDYQEIYYGYSPIRAGKIKLSSLDSDQDGLSDAWEIRLGTDLLKTDTDGDGHGDYQEVLSGYDPKTNSNQKISKAINVDIKTQTLSYFFGDIELDKFLISSGIKSMPTPTGDFNILKKVPVKNYGGVGFNFYYPNTKWNLHFTTGRWGYYIHGAYWHNKFGQPMSHGCINVPYNKMEKLYAFAQIGTEVIIK